MPRGHSFAAWRLGFELGTVTKPMRSSWLAGLALGLATLAPSAALAGDRVIEPSTYRTENYNAPVPETLAGAKAVLDADAAKKLMDAGTAVFIDVYPRPPKPANLPTSTLWRDPPHRSIKGAVWLANVGFGGLTEPVRAYFERELVRLSAGDKAKPLVFFCLRDCWMSWNAAKRALEMGYENVYWFSEGTDAWEEQGYEVDIIRPEP
jgi:PQQ-dependent catabolism-associated CXXCW motif protein